MKHHRVLTKKERFKLVLFFTFLACFLFISPVTPFLYHGMKNTYRLLTKQLEYLDNSGSARPLLQKWFNYSTDANFIEENCNHVLNVSKWCSEHAVICTMPMKKDKIVSGSIIVTGNWEPYLQTELFRDQFPRFPDAAFVDIGAHIGTYTISAAKMGRKVFAFEASRETFEYLRNSIAVNKLTDSVSLFNKAVMSSQRCVKLSLTNDSLDNVGGTQTFQDPSCSSNAEISAVTLDQLMPNFKSQNIQQAIIKVDIEGSEAEAILGGAQFLQEIDVPLIQMETLVLKRYEEGTKPGDRERWKVTLSMFQLLEDLKYSAFAIGGLEKLHVQQFKKWPIDVYWKK